jgi:hypothetical protein
MVDTILEECPELVHAIDKIKMTPLHYAVGVFNPNQVDII